LEFYGTLTCFHYYCLFIFGVVDVVIVNVVANVLFGYLISVLPRNGGQTQSKSVPILPSLIAG
jgi:hypothetical protein